MTDTEQDSAALAAQRTEDQKTAAAGNWIELLLYSGQLIGVFLRIVLGIFAGIVEIAFAFIAGLASLFP